MYLPGTVDGFDYFSTSCVWVIELCLSKDSWRGETCAWASGWILNDLDEGSKFKFFLCSDTMQARMFLPGTVNGFDFSSFSLVGVTFLMAMNLSTTSSFRARRTVFPHSLPTLVYFVHDKLTCYPWAMSHKSTWYVLFSTQFWYLPIKLYRILF